MTRIVIDLPEEDLRQLDNLKAIRHVARTAYTRHKTWQRRWHACAFAPVTDDLWVGKMLPYIKVCLRCL